MGFLGTLAKIGGAALSVVPGGSIARVALRAAGTALASSRPTGSAPPAYIAPPIPREEPGLWVPPPAPVMVAARPPEYILPHYSAAPAMGGGPVNTFDPPALTPNKGPTLGTAPVMNVHRKASPRAKAAAKKAVKRAPAKAVKKAAPKKPKFGTPAWRKKYMGKKKK